MPKFRKTISSRCQDFDFRHLEDEKIVERLQLIANDEEVSADSDVLALITRQSEGCLRDAENLLERLIASAGKDLTIEAVEQTIGLGSSSLLRNLAAAIIERQLANGLKTLNDLTKQGTDLSKCLDHLISHFRDLRLLVIDDSLSELVQSPKSDLPELKQQAERMSVHRLSRIIKILMHTSRDIKQYGYPQLQLEAAFIQLNSLEEGVQLEKIVDELSALERKFDAAGILTTGEVSPQQPRFSPGNSRMVNDESHWESVNPQRPITNNPLPLYQPQQACQPASQLHSLSVHWQNCLHFGRDKIETFRAVQEWLPGRIRTLCERYRRG